VNACNGMRCVDAAPGQHTERSRERVAVEVRRTRTPHQYLDSERLSLIRMDVEIAEIGVVARTEGEPLDLIPAEWRKLDGGQELIRAVRERVFFLSTPLRFELLA